MKSKLSKQQKKYIKACDSKELIKELKQFFKRENQLLQEAKDTPIVFKNGVFKTNNPFLKKYLSGFPTGIIREAHEPPHNNGNPPVRYSEDEIFTPFLKKSETPNSNSLTKEALESLTNPEFIENKKSMKERLNEEYNYKPVGIKWDKDFISENNETIKNPDLIDKNKFTQKLNQEQIDLVIEWMNTWEQLKDTAIPLRFKEDFKFKYIDLNTKQENNEIPMEFCVEITKENKEVLLELYNFKNDNEKINLTTGSLLLSNSLFSHLSYKSITNKDVNFDKIIPVSTEKFLHYIGKYILKKKPENDKTILEFDLPKSSRFDNIKSVSLKKSDHIYRTEPKTSHEEGEKIIERFLKIRNEKDVHPVKETDPKTLESKLGILYKDELYYKSNSVNIYTEEDMEKCFNSARTFDYSQQLNNLHREHKYSSFSDYLKTL